MSRFLYSTRVCAYFALAVHFAVCIVVRFTPQLSNLVFVFICSILIALDKIKVNDYILLKLYQLIQKVKFNSESKKFLINVFLEKYLIKLSLEWLDQYCSRFKIIFCNIESCKQYGGVQNGRFVWYLRAARRVRELHIFHSINMQFYIYLE